MTKRTLVTRMAAVFAAVGLSGPVLAECGGTPQCIGISATSIAEARTNHHPETISSTMAFGNVPVLSSTVKTLYVAAVTGPAGSAARLNPVVIGGPDSAQFTLVGGTCPLAGGDGPRHGNPATDSCTILVKFMPVSPGTKSATLTVPLTPNSPGNVDRRVAALSGVGGNERIAPTLEADVASLISSQLATQRRFAAAQVRNISNRLESLHRTPGIGGGSGTGLRVAANSVGGFGPAPTGPFGSGEAHGALPGFPDGRRDEQAGLEPREPDAATGMMLSLLTTGQVPVMLASDAGAKPGATDGGYWLGGIATFGRIGPEGRDTRFETSGFTVGVDRRLRRDLVVGGAAGYSRSHSTFGSNGSDSRFTGNAVSLYGSYEIVPDTYLDAILGYGTITSKSKRHVTVTNMLATSERDGSQVYGSLAFSKEIRDQNIAWSPYARLEFNRGTLDRTSETGAGISSLTYFEQKYSSSRLALGVRASAVHESEFGRVIPHIRIEYGRELQRAGSATIAYADQPGGTSYSVAPTSEKRGNALIGLGAELLTHRGIVVGFELGTNGRIRENPEYSTRFWLSTALDDMRPRPPGAAPASGKMPFTVSAGLLHDTNITRTGSPTPELSDRIWIVTGGIGDKVEFNDSMSLNYGATLGAEKYQTFDRLDTAILGLRAELAYQAGGLFTSPRFGVYTSLAHDNSRSDLRTGNRFEIGANTRVQVAERTGVSGVLAHNRRSARGDIYDASFTSLRGGADHQLGDHGMLLGALEFRRGDFVSSGIPAADSAAVSDALADDDAFPAKRFVAYRFRGRSLIATLGYRFVLGSRDSFDISWTGIRVKPTQAPDYNKFTYPFRLQRGQGGSSPYSVQQIGITYTMRF
ncbi:autotransporter domain-containing protein [Piscinibacter sakaiensis]|uniref:autotransporter domain-containing protein n=1 Tax=Piscinibacter sakaiensis TaxID=1547922 RepID=UPI003AAC2CA3